jgi:hypothetical protein
MDQTRGLLAAITKAQTLVIRNRDPKLVFDGLLGSLLELTSSEYGFIGEVTHNESGAPSLRTVALTRPRPARGQRGRRIRAVVDALPAKSASRQPGLQDEAPAYSRLGHHVVLDISQAK